jgi:hypothetical protein
MPDGEEQKKRDRYVYLYSSSSAMWPSGRIFENNDADAAVFIVSWAQGGR